MKRVFITHCVGPTSGPTTFTLAFMIAGRHGHEVYLDGWPELDAINFLGATKRPRELPEPGDLPTGRRVKLCPDWVEVIRAAFPPCVSWPLVGVHTPRRHLPADQRRRVRRQRFRLARGDRWVAPARDGAEPQGRDQREVFRLRIWGPTKVLIPPSHPTFPGKRQHNRMDLHGRGFADSPAACLTGVETILATDAATLPCACGADVD